MQPVLREVLRGFVAGASSEVPQVHEGIGAIEDADAGANRRVSVDTIRVDADGRAFVAGTRTRSPGVTSWIW